jgi:cysteine synthase
MLLNNILEAVGKTPVVRINRVGKELACELYGKCEFLNPGGSVKDRIAVEMVAQAEKEGRIKPGDTLIEATSGNAGIGFALAGAVKGYKVIITMPEKMSREKEVVLEALGAKIYRTPTEAKWDDPDSHISLAKRLQKEIPNAHILNQYTNHGNPDAHYQYTAQEILDDMGTDLAMVVMGVGTGGTITGVAKRLKKEIPHIQIIGVDPYGSILGGGTEVHPYLVEGIGYDFFPDVLDNKLVDEYVKVNDKDSFTIARRLIREEGLLVGGSSGTAVWAALQAAKRLEKGQKCLVVLPDGIRNYMSKFVDDKWMRENGFLPEKTEA